MLVQRYVNAYVVSFRNFYKVNQLVLSFIKFKVILFRSFDDFVLCFFQNLAILFCKFVIRQNIDVVDKFNEIET